MKKLIISSLLLGAVLGRASAQGAPSDVPRNHWAFEAVDSLFRLGLLSGYPAQGGNIKFRGDRAVSRYELSGTLHKLLGTSRLEAKLTQVQDQALRTDLESIRQAIAKLRQDVDALKAQGAEIQGLKIRYSDIGENIRKLREEIRSLRGQRGGIGGG